MKSLFLKIFWLGSLAAFVANAQQVSPDSALQTISADSSAMVADSTMLADSSAARADSTMFPGMFRVAVDSSVVFGLLSFDTTLTHGSRYGSFADVFDWLPGTFYLDRGSVGQPAYGTIFVGTAGRFTLLYDDLVLNDPLTGKADLNLIPTESVAHAVIPLQLDARSYGFLPVAQSLQIVSRDMASLPIKSRVAYRTGDYGFDDVDVRLGVQASPVLNINAGGILKNYAGTTYHSKYRAQKINLKVNRKLGMNWRAAYSLLLNKFDLDLPEPQPVPELNLYLTPHRKDERYDQGVFFRYKNKFTTGLQYTDLHRELYGNRRALLDQRLDANNVRVLSQYTAKVQGFCLQAGGFYRRLTVSTREKKNYTQWSFDGWFDVSLALKNISLQAGLRLDKKQDSSAFLAPELSVGFSCGYFDALMWMGRTTNAPGFSARYISTPYVLENPYLRSEQTDQVGLGIVKKHSRFDLYVFSTYAKIQNQILVQYDPRTFGIPGWANAPDQWRGTLDFFGVYKFTNLLQLRVKFRRAFYGSENSDFKPLNLPGIYGKGYIQFSHLFFQNDLDARIRFGFSFIGERYGPEIYYVHSSENIPLSGSVVPYLHGIFVIKDVTLFFSLDNPLSTDYQIVSGYPMPQRQLRWGFVWNLFD